MEPKFKHYCHLEAAPPKDAPLQWAGSMWVDVWARDFDHARGTLALWITQMGMRNSEWEIKSIKQSNDKE